jgi:hypothetical protein
MISLIELSYCKTVLRIEGADRDDLLNIMIPAASQLVINYLDDRASEIGINDSGIFIDSPPELPSNIMLATAMLVGYLINNSDSDTDKYFEMGYLPKPVMALLYTNRDPVTQSKPSSSNNSNCKPWWLP